MNDLRTRPLHTRLKNSIVKFFAIICACLFCCLICACDNNGNSVYGGDFDDGFIVYEGFSVNYLDVGNGDAILIKFDDGKTALIDCGEKNDRNLKTLTRYLNAYAGTCIDYLILTHPDSDHVGCAADVLENYTVKKAYIPYLLSPQNFVPYRTFYEKLLEKQNSDRTEIEYSAVNTVICGENYYLAFLSPDKWENPAGSAYYDINSAEFPSSDARNNVSPIIYLDYSGVRFIFTGDAGTSQEKVAINNVDAGIVDRKLNRQGKAPITLTDIDFLKVSHHGSSDASGAEFLQRITPKNAVISVGGDNRYGHPDKAVLSRISAANENCKIYLTSEFGTVSVLVDGNGELAVKTAYKAA